MKTFETRSRSAVLAWAIHFGLWAPVTSALAADPRFVPSATGEEVTDTQTGLIWRRCPEGQVWISSTCSGSSVYYTWDDALAHAKNTATSTGVAWRLPNVKELQTLVDRKLANPAIDSSVFPNVPSVFFWTSTPWVSNTSRVWLVHFRHGYVAQDYRNSNYYGGAVRLVRAGQ